MKRDAFKWYENYMGEQKKNSQKKKKKNTEIIFFNENLLLKLVIGINVSLAPCAVADVQTDFLFYFLLHHLQWVIEMPANDKMTTTTTNKIHEHRLSEFFLKLSECWAWSPLIHIPIEYWNNRFVSFHYIQSFNLSENVEMGIQIPSLENNFRPENNNFPFCVNTKLA